MYTATEDSDDWQQQQQQQTLSLYVFIKTSQFNQKNTKQMTHNESKLNCLWNIEEKKNEKPIAFPIARFFLFFSSLIKLSSSYWFSFNFVFFFGTFRSKWRGKLKRCLSTVYASLLAVHHCKQIIDFIHIVLLIWKRAEACVCVCARERTLLRLHSNQLPIGLLSHLISIYWHLKKKEKQKRERKKRENDLFQ